jgi:hypothetical protein
MIQYCIHERIIFVDPTSFSVSLTGQTQTAAKILMGFLDYVLERLPWEDVDITQQELPALRKQTKTEEIPRIQDPYEKNRNLGCYLNKETWSRLQGDVWDLRADLTKSTISRTITGNLRERHQHNKCQTVEILLG